MTDVKEGTALPQSQNRVGIDIQVKSNAQEQIKQLNDRLLESKPVSEAARASLNAFGGQLAQVGKEVQKTKSGLGSYDAEIRQWAQGVQKLEEAYQQASREAKLLPSALEKMRLEVQKARIGYVEGLGDMAEETLNFADVLDLARSQAEDFSFRTGRIWEGVSQKFNATFTEQAQLAFKAGGDAFKKFHESLDEGLSTVFTTAFTKNTANTLKSWEKFVESLEQSFYQSLGRMASALVQENVLAPLFRLGQGAAGTLLEAGKSFLGLSEGGLVTRPTLAVVGEAGPEVVLPLEAAGEFVKKTLIGAAQETALNEAAKRAALEAGLEIGAERAAQGAAAAAGAVTGAALLAMLDAVQTALGGNSALRAAGDLLFGERGPGVVSKGLSALGIGAFSGGSISPEAHGRGNVELIGRMLEDAAASFGELGIGLQQLIDATGGDPWRAEGLIRAAIGGRPRLSSLQGGFFGLPVEGDAAGRFVTGPSLRLLGEMGPEHVLNVDSGPSVRALQEGLRPIVREIFEEERRASGGPARGITVNVDARGALFPDERGMERLARMIEEKLRAFQSRRVGYAGA